MQQEILTRLDELFAEEVEAAIRYLHLAMTVKGLDRLIVRDTLFENMKETIEHAQMIADKILQLGGVPSLQLKLNLAPEKSSGAEAIRTALIFEQAALDAYSELLEHVKGDPRLEEFVRSQVAVESEHVAQLALLLED